ncbi:MAG: nuclear transport factor 2 family protein [Terriglobales bacterium]
MVDTQAFAREWIAAWNRGDVEAVLAHFAEDAVFVSPLAAAVTGNAEVRGKAALRAYWTAALRARGTPPRFTLDSVVWDAERRAIVILYASAERGGAVRKAELMEFGEDQRIHRGEAFAGAISAAAG